MNFLTAVQQATELLRQPTLDDVAEQVAIELVVDVWPRFAATDSTWDFLAIDLLSVRDTLYPDRAPVVIAVDASTVEPGAARDAVRQLLVGLAERYEHVAGVDHSRRLRYAAAALEVRRAVGASP